MAWSSLMRESEPFFRFFGALSPYGPHTTRHYRCPTQGNYRKTTGKVNQFAANPRHFPLIRGSRLLRMFGLTARNTVAPRQLQASLLCSRLLRYLPAADILLRLGNCKQVASKFALLSASAIFACGRYTVAPRHSNLNKFICSALGFCV